MNTAIRDGTDSHHCNCRHSSDIGLAVKIQVDAIARARSPEENPNTFENVVT